MPLNFLSGIAAENIVVHIFLKNIKQNLHFTFYPTWHMIYIDKPAPAQLKNDFLFFMQTSLPNYVVCLLRIINHT